MDDFAAGVRRFIVGLGKKVLIANNVASAADGIFALAPAELTPAHAWLGIICYTLQIYFDFSGYSDMAIGLGRMFGFRFPENFRWPYVADTVQEFRRRWHISLSSWFRDYRRPLGGSRQPGTDGNLVLVFFLCPGTGRAELRRVGPVSRIVPRRGTIGPRQVGPAFARADPPRVSLLVVMVGWCVSRRHAAPRSCISAPWRESPRPASSPSTSPVPDSEVSLALVAALSDRCRSSRRLAARSIGLP
jgi:hypothetical protein